MPGNLGEGVASYAGAVSKSLSALVNAVGLPNIRCGQVPRTMTVRNEAVASRRGGWSGDFDYGRPPAPAQGGAISFETVGRDRTVAHGSTRTRRPELDGETP